MNDRQLIELLAIIRRLALIGYPLPDGANPKLVFALGEIGGIANRALTDASYGTDAGGDARGRNPNRS